MKRHIRWLVLLAIVCAAQLQALDLNSDKLSDVWLRALGLEGMGLVAEGDDDFDGIVNWEEFAFGLHPLVSNQKPVRIEPTAPDNLDIFFLAPAWQKFRFESRGDLLTGNWSDASGTLTGTGNYLLLSEDPTGMQKQFFRVVYLGSDDNDGDQLTQYEEAMIGTLDTAYSSDADLMDDAWEWLYGLDPLADDGGLNPEGDVLLGVAMTNAFEYLINSHPGHGYGPEASGGATVALEVLAPQAP